MPQPEDRYDIVQAPTAPEVIEKINAAADGGWELVTVTLEPGNASTPIWSAIYTAFLHKRE